MKRVLASLFFAAIAAISFGQDKLVLGKLGQTIAATSIRRAPGDQAGTYYRCKPFEYLVIRPSKYEKWLQVVLQNGRVGYILADKVARLPYDVTLDNTYSSGATSTSRGGLTLRAAAAEYGLNFKGTPYKWGGNDLLNGIDCSGFVKQLFGKIGIDLPRTAAEQALVGQPITRLEDLQKGDRLYFWEEKRNKIGHTGIYLGNGFFVHSSSSRKGVATDTLENPKWRKILVAARR
jgi:hypothetical protein